MKNNRNNDPIRYCGCGNPIVRPGLGRPVCCCDTCLLEELLAADGYSHDELLATQDLLPVNSFNRRLSDGCQLIAAGGDDDDIEEQEDR